MLRFMYTSRVSGLEGKSVYFLLITKLIPALNS
jgi:hypothetical protein